VSAEISSLAAWLLAPYLAWVTFAGWLNWRVVQLNKPFGRQVDTALHSRVGNDGRLSR
jgi:TspO/MBR family